MERRRLYTPLWEMRSDTPDAVCRGSVVERMRRVLRLRPGDACELIPGDGWIYRVRLVTFTGHQEARVVIEERFQPPTEPTVEVVLAVGMLKHERLDDVVFTGTELGMTQFVPLITRRTVVQPRPERWVHRRQRWERLAAEALESSGRTRMPVFLEPMVPVDLLARLPETATVLWLLEPRHARTPIALWDWVYTHPVPASGPVVLVVGPEGGWSPEEITSVTDPRIVWVHVGNRILRSPTSAVAALALLLPLTTSPQSSPNG